jgi:hypothetical protein
MDFCKINYVMGLIYFQKIHGGSVSMGLSGIDPCDTLAQVLELNSHLEICFTTCDQLELLT